MDTVPPDIWKAMPLGRGHEFVVEDLGWADALVAWEPAASKENHLHKVNLWWIYL